MSDVLKRLAEVIDERRAADPKDSYVAGLFHAGLDKILKKVGEEATEVILAAKDAESGGDRNAVISEVADLWFHSMVMLSALGESPDSVLKELQKRFNLSGLVEKAQRQTE